MSRGPILALVAPDGESAVPPETVLLGLPIIRRTVLAARRGGFARVVVIEASAATRTALEGTAAELATAVPEGAQRFPWNVVVGVKDLRKLAAGGDPIGAGVPVAAPSDLPRAERYLLRGLIKDTEGLMSRYFDRTISLAVSRRLAATRVAPNHMTLISTGIGLAGAPFFLSSRPAIQVVGGLLFLLHSILDGCDGELARLKFQESRFGGVLDFWGDNVVHMAVFTGMAIGLAQATGRSWPLWCGASAVAGTLASAWFIYRRTMMEPKEGPLYTSVAKHGASRISRIADALSRRDFIYLVLILSAFGKADWFIVLTAGAVPAFFLAIVIIAWNERRTSRSASHE